MVLGDLTDFCLTWTWFLMISGNPSSKCQSLTSDQTDVWHKYMQRVKGVDFLMGYAVPCSSSHARVRKTSSLQGSWRGVHYFSGSPLAIFYGNLYNLWFSRGWRSGPHAFIRIRTCFFFKTLFPYLRIFHSLLNHFTRLYKVRTWPITWYLETGVRQYFTNTTFLVKRKFCCY